MGENAMAIYAYARCSTKKQDPERQLRNIRAVYPDAKFFFDIFTGTKMEGRKDWNRLMKLLKPENDDKIVFDSVSRMSRNADEGVEEYKRLYNMGITLEFLKEPHINTEVYRAATAVSVPMTGTDVDIILEGVNKYLMAVAEKQIRLAFEQAEKEVLDLRQRTCEGIVTAKLNGKKPGRREGKFETKKSIDCKAKIKRHSKDYGGTMSDIEMIQFLDIARGTYYKYKRELEMAEMEKLSEETENNDQKSP